MRQKQPQHLAEDDREDYDRSHRRIQFNSNVMVVPIPSRHAYSKRIKQAFWMGGAEIQANAERNRYEFASEGWDFHQVLEDEDFYVDTSTGQLVHPCWVEDEEDDDDADYDDEGNVIVQSSSCCDGNGKRPLYVEAPMLRRTNSGVFELLSLGAATDDDEDAEAAQDEENVGDTIEKE